MHAARRDGRTSRESASSRGGARQTPRAKLGTCRSALFFIFFPYIILPGEGGGSACEFRLATGEFDRSANCRDALSIGVARCAALAPYISVHQQWAPAVAMEEDIGRAAGAAGAARLEEEEKAAVIPRQHTGVRCGVHKFGGSRECLPLHHASAMMSGGPRRRIELLATNQRMHARLSPGSFTAVSTLVVPESRDDVSWLRRSSSRQHFCG